VRTPLLAIRNLSVHFTTAGGVIRAVDGATLALNPGETLGLVGESGSGKSVTALSVTGILPHPARVAGGRIDFDGRDLLQCHPDVLRRIRGRDIGMIFQEPMTALNPVMTIGRQVAEPVVTHFGLSRSAARAKTIRWLERVRLPSAKSRLGAYPHELSGGMRQRVMIAMAMICRPRLLIADEPTTALDVTTQQQILALMDGLKRELATAMLLITHDLGVVAQHAGHVAVMYAGRIVETAAVHALFQRPLHPYTRGLIAATPQLGMPRGPLPEISGTPPDPTRRISGCSFADRCPDVFEHCRVDAPRLAPVLPGRQAACWLYPPMDEAAGKRPPGDTHSRADTYMTNGTT
jgi:peptide/nickel transport system ATP-binding protein